MADKGSQGRIKRERDMVKNPPDYAHLGGQKVKRLVKEGKEHVEETRAAEKERREQQSRH